MKSQFVVWTVSLLAVLVVSSCAAAVTDLPAAATKVPTSSITLPTSTSTLQATSTVAPTVQAVATSRGPNLEATDPTTVDLASGKLQLVEFFRFT